MRHRIPIIAAIACSSAFIAVPAFSADYTDLVDAADDMDDLIDETYDGFDFNIEPRFRMDFGKATITREAACVPSQGDLVGRASTEFAESNPRLEVDPTRCAEPEIVDNNEAEYRRRKMTMDVTLKGGLYKDLELHINIPYVFSDVHGMKYAEGVNGRNSSIDPDQGRVDADFANQYGDGPAPVGDLEFFSTYRYFDLEDDYVEKSRGGFGDPSIGLWWAPFNDYRDDTKATLILGMDWLVPMAPLMKGDNEAVGRGMHELSWTIASSKRFDFIEPYFGLKYILALAAPNSPIRQLDTSNDGQVFIAPPQRGEITIGTEFIGHENAADGSRYGVDLQFRFGYTSEGRDYTPLFDHMMDSECHGQNLDELLESDGIECAWVAQQPANAPEFGGDPNPIYDLTSATGNPDFPNYDGISTVESYGTWAGKIGVLLQPSPYFQLKAGVQLENQQEHSLTNARTGRDVDDSLEEDNDGTVDLQGPDAALEKNAVFNPTYDGTGRRFRIKKYNTWSVFITAAVKF